jgi:hypothetical protein
MGLKIIFSMCIINISHSHWSSTPVYAPPKCLITAKAEAYIVMIANNVFLQILNHPFDDIDISCLLNDRKVFLYDE